MSISNGSCQTSVTKMPIVEYSTNGRATLLVHRSMSRDHGWQSRDDPKLLFFFFGQRPKLFIILLRNHSPQQDETFVSETMAPFLLRDRFQAAALSRKRFKSKAKHGSNRMKDMKESFKRLKSEMEEISEEQKNIREGQRQVKEKFESIESECEELKRETRLIIQQSARTQIKLTLMFRILKAREASDFNIAAQLTEVLRAIIRREEWEKAKLTVE